MTLIEKMAQAAAGPEDWLRASPRARGEYRRMVRRALVVLGEHRGGEFVRSAVLGALEEDARHG